MTIRPLSPVDLTLAALLVLLVAALTWRMRLGLGRQVTIAAVRTVVQLTLIGFVLRQLFAHARLAWIVVLAVAMLFAAGREVRARQQRNFRGVWGYGLGTASLFVSSFAVAVFALVVMVGAEPWYDPRYAIPLLGMLLGNTMTGIAVALDRLVQAAWERRRVIEQRLALGYDRGAAFADIRRDSVRSGLIPIVNAMAAAGIVSLPGMMTGQILAGNPPMVAVRYQILILFLIAGGTGLGTILAATLASRRLFDDRHRLRLDRVTARRVRPFSSSSPDACPRARNATGAGGRSRTGAGSFP